ncbi:MAG: hypothetical protein AAGH79_10760 [Bacteroidota bacterium]
MTNDEHIEEYPPILKTWPRLYWTVLIIHALIITAFYLFTQYFS